MPLSPPLQCLLQTFIAHRALTRGRIQEVLARVLPNGLTDQIDALENDDDADADADADAERDAPRRSRDQVSSSEVTEAIALLNAAIGPMDFEIRRVRKEVATSTSDRHTANDAQRSEAYTRLGDMPKAEPLWVFCNAAADGATKLATAHSADEIGYVRRLLRKMLVDNNTLRQEILAVSAKEAIMLASTGTTTAAATAARAASPQHTRATQTARHAGDDDDAEATSATAGGGATNGVDGTSATTGTAAPVGVSAGEDEGGSLTKSHAERLLQELVAEAWLDRSPRGWYTLTARAVAELAGYLDARFGSQARVRRRKADGRILPPRKRRRRAVVHDGSDAEHEHEHEPDDDDEQDDDAEDDEDEEDAEVVMQDVPAIRSCSICKTPCLKGYRCSDVHCGGRVHASCLKGLLHDGSARTADGDANADEDAVEFEVDGDGEGGATQGGRSQRDRSRQSRRRDRGSRVNGDVNGNASAVRRYPCPACGDVNWADWQSLLHVGELAARQ